MRVFAKITVAFAATSALAGKKKGNNLGYKAAACAMGFLANCPGAAAAAQVDLATKFTNSHSELSQLLANPDAMEARFEQFYTDKYVCPQGAATSSQCSPWSFDDLQEESELSVANKKYDAFVKNVEAAHARNEEALQKARDNIPEGAVGSVQIVPKVVHGITPLMDLDEDEFKKLLGVKFAEGETMETMRQKYDKRSPAEVRNKCQTEACEKFKSEGGAKDWRDDDVITDVKDQGQCGSCWAFSTVETIESKAIQDGLASKYDPFIGSPQELVSCDHHSDQGCNGGLPINAFEWLKNKPLESESDYPYVSGDTKKSGTCKIDTSEGKFEVTSSKLISEDSSDETGAMTDFILGEGPMSIGVAANTKWQTYLGGTLSVDDCPSVQPNHAVQAVALKKSDDPWSEGGYWVVRNSWGPSWGEEGFIRLDYGDDVCSISAMAATAEVEKVDANKATSSLRGATVTV